MLRLLELKLINHPIIGDLNFEFSDKIDDQLSNYNTIIIGSNGTGKSYILQTIINIFREGAAYLKNKERSRLVNGSFYLKYIFDGKIIEIANYAFSDEILNSKDKSSVYILSDGFKTDSKNILPNKVLASSMIFTDKFPAVSDEKFSQYIYLGVRNLNSPSSAGTKAINTKVVDALTTSLTRKGFLETLKKVLVDLDYSPSISISYVPKYRTIFYGKELSVEKLKNMFNNWKDTFTSRKSAPWGIGYYISIRNNDVLLSKIVDFLNTKKFKPYGKGGRYFEYDLLKENVNAEEYEVLYHLHKLDLVSFPKIEMAKIGSKFGISESSSGEQNILFTLLTLLSNVENGSVIIIDEPELSLHPNWQMQYFTILREVFRQFKSIHFIIATHSHFMISDIKGENSKIVGLNKIDGKLNVIDLPFDLDTYGWSADEVLYSIFNVKTTRNFSLETDLRELLYKISVKSKDFERMESIVYDLKKLKLNPKDPLKIIITKAEEYLYK